ncbi:MoaD/ThiS family protein [Polaribacter porphyrae]|uniref:Molybdopterin synthase sulfur carrier subunit n=1 Tax=Polaribacter porphyrae TaxID=1137780 RepID=A0A2S7WPE1_9FLAO|nr:MoaD/ThiS family protein [Polaribacter porphyrae]PQJ79470.1 molybdopterin synthase sulfur carrier subunit [Polaribacter porphyrae]
MKIKTLFFGITTDLIGTSTLEINVDEKTTVAGFKTILKDEFHQLENINSYAIAVNEEYANDDVILKLGDIVAVIPPVSGG